MPIRAGTDIAFLGGWSTTCCSNDLDFREYVVAYTNAATIIDEDFQDTEDLDGLFSGFDPETRPLRPDHAGSYEPPEDADEDERSATPSSSSADEAPAPSSQAVARRRRARRATAPAARRSAGRAARDETLQHPRCVFQILKRHFARYTPEMVQEVCGIAPEQFRAGRRGADRATAAASGPPRSATPSAGPSTPSARRYIRTAAILQTLLGNIGRPGGGIMALRGHASIQGSTDIPTLFNLLPGYLPMPHADAAPVARRVRAPTTRARPASGATCGRYTVSLLKAYWGDAATAGERLLLRLPAAADRRPHDVRHGEGADRRAAARATSWSARTRRSARPTAGCSGSGLANLDWLVVRDLQMIESATFWKDGPEIETGELVTEDIGTEVFFLPAAAHTEKAGTLHPDPADAAVAPQGGRAAGRRPQRAVVLLPPRPADPREAGRAPPTRWTGRCST